jgi:transcriptional regulator with XRE-family HTH domain
VELDVYLRRVGENLRRARWAAGLTQENVAAGRITYRYYQELERGLHNPTLRTLHALAKHLNTTIAALCEVDRAATGRAIDRMAEYGLEAPKRGRKPRGKRR